MLGLSVDQEMRPCRHLIGVLGGAVSHRREERESWTAITQLAHHGMLFVPMGYTFGAGMFKMDTIRGGSPYGAGVFAGDGTRNPTDTELALAEHQGKYMGAVVKRLAQA